MWFVHPQETFTWSVSSPLQSTPVCSQRTTGWADFALGLYSFTTWTADMSPWCSCLKSSHSLLLCRLFWGLATPEPLAGENWCPWCNFSDNVVNDVAQWLRWTFGIQGLWVWILARAATFIPPPSSPFLLSLRVMVKILSSSFPE